MKPWIAVLITIIVMLILDHILVGIANRRLLALKAVNGPTSNVTLTSTTLETGFYVVSGNNGPLTALDY
jgi:hypothetical protein